MAVFFEVVDGTKHFLFGCGETSFEEDGVFEMGLGDFFEQSRIMHVS